MRVNQKWGVAARPEGKPKPSDFIYSEAPIGAPGQGEVLLETLYLGIAPVMRMYMMNGPECPMPMAGEAPLNIGDTIHGRGVARVIESHHPDYKAGDIVQGQLGWQRFKISKMTPAERFLRVKHHDLSYAHSVRILSMTGLTAFTAFYDRCRPKAGETILVTGAAGGVGHMVLQMAKIEGLRVVGMAGGPKKCAIVKDLGADEVIDYKNEDVPARIAQTCPGGMDIYFDNVGGEILSACLDNLAYGARVLLCGSISEYGRAVPFGLENYTRLRRVEGDMLGYFVYNYISEFDRANAALAGWIESGVMTPLIDELVGFDKMPEALIGVYEGNNVGTRCVKVKLDE